MTVIFVNKVTVEKVNCKASTFPIHLLPKHFHSILVFPQPHHYAIQIYLPVNVPCLLSAKKANLLLSVFSFCGEGHLAEDYRFEIYFGNQNQRKHFLKCAQRDHEFRQIIFFLETGKKTTVIFKSNRHPVNRRWILLYQRQSSKS